MYIRDSTTSGSNYESVYLNVQPNTIIYFDTSSMMQGVNASIIPITASWALTASVTQVFVSSSYSQYADTASFVATASSANTASFALNANSSPSASWASQSLSSSFATTASYVAGVGTTLPYTTLTTSSLNWITCSFLDSKEFISITNSASYNFTCSNVPVAGLLSEVSLFISNSAQFTSSLTFPSNWIFFGSKPNAITASKCAILSLQSYGPSVQVAGWSVQY